MSTSPRTHHHWISGAIVVGAFAAIVLAMLMLLWMSLGTTPSCADRGGVSTIWEGEESCLLPGGVVAPN